MVPHLLNRREVVTIPPTAAPQEGLTPASLLVVPKGRLKKKLGQLEMRRFFPLTFIHVGKKVTIFHI